MLRILYRNAPDEQVSRDRRLDMIDLLKSYEEKAVLRFCLDDEFSGEWAGDLVKWVLMCKPYKVLVPVLGDLICSKILYILQPYRFYTVWGMHAKLLFLLLRRQRFAVFLTSYNLYSLLLKISPQGVRSGS